MSQNKLSLKHEVITMGTGNRKAVLDYESGLVYQDERPENIIAMYQNGKGWIVIQKPYYSSGGWGSGSHGDGEGHYLVNHAQDMIISIEGTYYELNSKQFRTNQEISNLNKEIKNNNELIKKQNILAQKLEREPNQLEMLQLESIKTKLMRKGKTFKGINPIQTAKAMKNAASVFLTGKGESLQVDNYNISKNIVKQGSTTVAVKDSSGNIILNSMVLQTTSFERQFMGNQSLIQSEIRKSAKYSIPFNVLESAGLKLSDTKVLEQGPEATYQIKDGLYSSKLVERHFTGALLLENSGRKFLMDIDRLEIQSKIFNAFFVEVKGNVNSIAEAYESMKPDKVRQAEAQGVEVKRQGEWFFIKADKTLKILSDKVYTWKNNDETKQVHRFDIAHGKGRPNRLYKPVGFGELDQYVCGTVSHSGREHADLDLGQNEVTSSGNGNYTTFELWTVVPNTTVSNFTISGDID